MYRTTAVLKEASSVLIYENLLNDIINHLPEGTCCVTEGLVTEEVKEQTLSPTLTPISCKRRGCLECRKLLVTIYI